MSKPANIVLVSGGTGGHLYPAIALGAELAAQGHEVHFITDRRGKNHIHGNADITHVIKASNRANFFRRYLILMWDFICCFFLYVKLRPHIVMGFGGYPTLAPLSAAIILRIPVMIHEQNALLGKANRALFPYAKKVALSFTKTYQTPDQKNFVTSDKARVTGNPVRPLIHTESTTKDPACFYILVIGGSQGAKIFCDLLPEALKLLSHEDQQRLRLQQQCRPEYLDKTNKLYQDMGIHADLNHFVKDMGDAYAKADLVICRSGASTIAEVLALGKAALYVPLPSSADNHQYLNARAVADHDAGWVYEQKHLTPSILADQIKKFMDQPSLLQKTEKSALSISKPDAAKELAKLVISLYSETAG